MKNSKYFTGIVLFSIVIGTVICFIIAQFSRFAVENIMMKNNLVNWTLYEGFSGYLFLIYSCLVSFCCLMNKKQTSLFLTSICFFVIYVLLDFVLSFYSKSGNYISYLISFSAFFSMQIWWLTALFLIVIISKTLQHKLDKVLS